MICSWESYTVLIYIRPFEVFFPNKTCSWQFDKVLLYFHIIVSRWIFSTLISGNTILYNMIIITWYCININIKIVAIKFTMPSLSNNCLQMTPLRELFFSRKLYLLLYYRLSYFIVCEMSLTLCMQLFVQRAYSWWWDYILVFL